ncbi:MAG: hypothetical protein H7Z14_10115 [Anaerolineae bacterium]|nr:hypothetical protein [Phycisphaerae bacterium]
MKVTVDLSASELDEIRMYTGESKKGPAIRKMVIDALMLKRRARLSQKFIAGSSGVELTGFEAGRARDRQASKRREGQWRK